MNGTHNKLELGPVDNEQIDLNDVAHYQQYSNQIYWYILWKNHGILILNLNSGVNHFVRPDVWKFT